MANELTYSTTSNATEFLHLTKVGFSARQAEFLTTVEDWTDADARRRFRHAFSSRQWRALTEGPIDMATLLRGGFTRHQATLVIRANA